MRLRTARLRSAAAAALLCVAAAACAGDAGGADGTTVVAGFFPLADAARSIAGDAATVVDLTPPGGEAHDLELTTDDIDAVATADVVVTLGSFQPALADAAARSDGIVVDVSAEAPGAGHPWLDPALMARMAARIEAALAEADPARAGTYRANGDAYRTALARLDADYTQGLRSCERRTVVTAHDAFGALDRYGLDTEPITGTSPEAEPDPARLDGLTRIVEQTGTTTIFTEPGTPPQAAETLARETGARLAELNPLESRPAPSGATYESVMRANLAALRDALGCAA